MSNYMNLRNIEKINIDWICKVVQNIYETVGTQENINDYLEECCYFVTITFEWERLIAKRHETSINNAHYEMLAARILFRNVCSAMDRLSGNFSLRPRPFAIFATDFEGSKFGSFKDFQLHNVHLHSLWCGHPSEGQTLGQALSSFQAWYQTNKHFVDKIDVRPFDATKFTLESSASYLLKSWIKDTPNASAWADIEILDGMDPKFRLNANIPKKYQPSRVIKRLAKRALEKDETYPWED